MDIFEFAIQMERDGEQYYREMAAKTSHPGLQSIVLMLADDEKKHARIVSELQSAIPDMPSTTVLDSAKNIFQQMKQFGGEIDLSGDQEQLYRDAMVLEERSISFYLDRADQVRQPEQKTLFKRLAEEERKHYRLLQDLADFVRRPKTWLENAEFFHLDDY